MPRYRPGPAALAIAAGSWALAAGALVLAPTLAATDPGTRAPDLGSAPWWTGLAIVTLQGIALCWARPAPRTVLVATAALVPLAAVAGLGDAVGVTTVAVVVAAFLAALDLSYAVLWPSLAATALLLGAGAAWAAVDAGSTWPAAIGGAALQSIGSLALVLLVAGLVVTRRESRRAREGQARALEREQQARVQAAIAEERTAMARELHDIAAHHLSGIAVMTAAIGTQIDTDPAAAKAGVQQVRDQSRAVLRDLRSLVGLLRDGGAPDGTRPESLAGIGALVAERTAAGSAVELTVLQGAAPPGAGIGPLAQLAAYRIVQEALSNAARHAPGAPVRVEVDERPADHIRISVRNACPDPAPGPYAGFGLVGMRERAELTGARLEAGPAGDGDWQVLLHLPREADTGLEPRAPRPPDPEEPT